MAVANDDRKQLREETPYVALALIEDRWFDPDKGQDDRLKGEMATFRYITARGMAPSKGSHTLRGLAQHGYHYMTTDQEGLVRDWLATRDDIMARYERGFITLEEARLQYPPWADLMRRLEL